MPKTIRAGDKDTFCTIAIREGFKDCTLLRSLKENKDKFGPDWVLKAGDLVHLPDLKKKKDPAPT